MEKVTFHGRDDGRDSVRSVKHGDFVTACIIDDCKFYVRDVRSF